MANPHDTVFCVDCLHYEPLNADTKDAGDCRRYAPRPQTHTDAPSPYYAAWPIVQDLDNCAEGRPR